ncbi:neutral trehalase [Opitutaceae bacterium TAV1]|nr:neutral trehalase [Opitutaceae bacterium TAV1]
MIDPASFLHPETIAAIKAFITARWDETVRTSPEDRDTLIGLPFPYTIPCRRDAFQELYYWDTWFTAVGLLGTGRAGLAVDNTRNLLAQVRRFGFVPNGNRTYYLSRSQPPYLAPLVDLVASATGNRELVREAVPLLEREYAFWTTRRQSPAGLSHHGNHATREELIEFFPTVRNRLGMPDARAEDHLDLASRTMAECETGWDLNSRFDRRCPDFCPVDLNSNLWLYETLLARWAGDAGDAGGRAAWLERADRRRELLNTLCWDQDRGVFVDHDHVNRRRSEVLTAATFQPLWTGLADARQAAAVVEKALPVLESAFGVASVEPAKSPGVFQWDFPNGWPCIQLLVYRGLERYGFRKEARRVAEKYVASVCRSFAESGDLWEKYNVLDGTQHTVEEAGYLINPVNLAAGKEDRNGSPGTAATREPPAMMGWTAGVFIDAVNYLAGESV